MIMPRWFSDLRERVVELGRTFDWWVNELIDELQADFY